MRSRLLSILALVALAATCTGGLCAQGKVLLEPAEALELAFPKCKFERKSHVLSDKAKAEIKKRSGHAAPRSMLFVYEARKGKEVVGYAYFDRHRVRSKKELLMVAVDTNARASRVEVVAFEEPVDYMPRGIWYDQFRRQGLGGDLSVKTGVIKPVAGCTLTVQATVGTVRRILASHQMIYPVERPVAGSEPSERAKPAKPKQSARFAPRVAESASQVLR